MAGFDFDITLRRSQRDATSAILRHLQAIACDCSIEMRYKWQNGRYYVTIDGKLPLMQALALRIETELPAHAKGLQKRYGSSVTRLSDRTVNGYMAGLYRITGGVAEVADLISGTPSSYVFDIGKSTHLTGATKAFTNSLVLYYNGLLPLENAVETAHTAVELLLKNALGTRAAKGKSFKGLVELAQDRGILSSEHATSLIKLKDHRKRAKHRGQRIPDGIGHSLLIYSVHGCHQLLRKIRRANK